MDEIPGLRRTAFRAHLSRLKKPEADTTERVITGPLARCSTALVRPHSIDALAADYTSRIGSLYDGVPGFEGALLLLNRGSNKAQSISLWRGTADFEAAAATPAYRENMAALGSHFLAAPQLEVWEHAGCERSLQPSPPDPPSWRLSADRPTPYCCGGRSLFAERQNAPSPEDVRVLQQRVAFLKQQAPSALTLPLPLHAAPPHRRTAAPPHHHAAAPPRRRTAAPLPAGPSVPV